ncbi:angiogenic factor with G patch and FHA domains 1 isoform X1 [Hylaeus volcanicus]|uniref:angiogenic factor with G patch and FHA domains 1 isoform X1 n=1 Tax=Hylaeus volcanicus TaxID=313075 RepID=UPI0023B796A7|nr:angiogenic factor with G patch and FHA domains 1 isoform X1 [Hylaeus volcanicus]XP_053984068.1 angiogenic factor with G patch and FHA domains 1 isoform X1 [Hylaeus volcanicus]XP_053984069.1 angiogenic factor with G patch and FHA domains 1 isoform X1 [Hylaeus volcanicus]
MIDNNEPSESDEGEIKSDFEEDFQEELCNLPHVLRFIQRMREHIKKQNKKISKLRNKLNEHRNQKLLKSKTLIDYGTQTNPLEYEKEPDSLHNWGINSDTTSASIVDQVKEAAESALLQTGFVYEETSGLYYDYNSGYYYDAKQGLYYNGNSGTYYVYDKATGIFQFHSQAQVAVNEASTNSQSKKEQKTRKANKDEGKTRKLAKREDQLEDNELEEGECTSNDNDSNSNDITPELCTSSDSDHEEDQDLAKIYPPCMRIIAKETDLPKLKVGSLFVVAYTGGSIGREGDHSVVIPDINVSKHHARFVYDEDKKVYQIIDSGSRNGTFLNGKRLSVAKQESAPCEVSHGSIIQVGSTKLLCHIHNGNETCGHCEPGLVQHNSVMEENKTSKKDLHKQELRRLKYKFGVEKDNVATASQVASGYQDRAHSRRQCIGSSNHHAKTQQSSMDVSIAKDNRGFKLLSKMGWTEGQSLGKEGDGRTEPIPMTNNPSRTGLGTTSEFPTIELDSMTEKKQALWRKTQQRYKDITDQTQ